MLNDPVLTQEWFAVARSADVPAETPVAVRLLGRDVVLWRSGDGLHAWRDLCIHRGAKLSLGSVRRNCLVCPYHGWEYDAAGACVHIPAQPGQPPPLKAHAEVFRAVERYGLIWVSIGEQGNGLPDFAEFMDKSYRTVICGPYFFHAQGPRILENFLDVGHLPIVHAGFLGDPAHAQIEDYEVETSRNGVLAQNIPIWQQDPDGTGMAAHVFYTYRVYRPLMASFSKLHNGRSMMMAAFVTPLDEQQSVLWTVVAMNYEHGLTNSQVMAFQDTITSQDKPIVESQRPELLPLDLQAELHLRSDKMAIAYRRWLRALGLQYGTA